MKSRVDILLATHNGAEFLGAQLDSILCQTLENWRLLVRDDCSADATPSILAGYQARFPDKITILSGEDRKLGAAGNFSLLLTAADADYIMLCDQDDVWAPGKIEKSMAVMEGLERLHGPALPLLVHTDLAVTDCGLTPIAGSLWKFQHSDPVNGVALNRLLTQNVVTGCTVMINRALRDLALPIPAGAVMHDWWLALVSSAFGAMGNIPEPTVLYRQHGANDIGATGFDLSDIVRRFARWHEINEVVRRLYRQAAVFLDRYQGRLTPLQREMLEAFATMDRAGFFERRFRFLKYRFFYAGLLRNVGRFILG